MIVLAGPNGAGKSTFHASFLADLPYPFVNPDNIAKALFGPRYEEHAVEAAALASQLRALLFDLRKSFILETVFSDPAGDKLDFFRRAGEAGYLVRLVFIGLASPTHSLARVMQRVEDGGHNVPREKIESRYARILLNLQRALAVVRHIEIYDNSSPDTPYTLVARIENGRVTHLGEIPSYLEFLDLPSLPRSSAL
jgi:predicted ABC-type ATPase